MIADEDVGLGDLAHAVDEVVCLVEGEGVKSFVGVEDIAETDDDVWLTFFSKFYTGADEEVGFYGVVDFEVWITDYKCCYHLLARLGS